MDKPIFKQGDIVYDEVNFNGDFGVVITEIKTPTQGFIVEFKQHGVKENYYYNGVILRKGAQSYRTLSLEPYSLNLEGFSQERKKTEEALSLIGRVGYFWDSEGDNCVFGIVSSIERENCTNPICDGRNWWKNFSVEIPDWYRDQFTEPEPQVGDIGYFWDSKGSPEDTKPCSWGQVSAIDIDTHSEYPFCDGINWWNNFSLLPPPIVK